MCDKIHDLDNWISVARVFSEATDIETKVIDKDGRVLYCSHDGYKSHELCKCIPSELCRKSHVFGARQSVEFGGSHTFICPAGMAHFSSPIIQEGALIGAIISGHFLLNEPDIYLIKYLMKYVEDEKVIKDFVMDVEVYDQTRLFALVSVLRSLSAELSDGSKITKKEKLPLEFLEVKHMHSIHQVINYMKGHYMEKITLVEAAKTVHFSPQYLSKIFKDETGYTFKQYLNMIRIENSKKLLKEGDLSLMDICYLVGFSDQSHFSRTFKKISGMSPKKYLEQQDVE